MSKEIALQRIELAEALDLKVLDLSGLELTEIPSQISRLENLERLCLSNNQLTAIGILRNLKMLKELDLEKNELTKIPEFLFALNCPLSWEKKQKKDDPFLVLIFLKLESLAVALAQSRAQELDIDLRQARVLVRALALVRDLALDIDADLERCLGLARDLAENLARSLAIWRSLGRGSARDRARDRDRARARDRARNRAISLSVSLDRDRALSRDLSLAIARARDLVLIRDQNKDRIEAQSPVLDRELELDFDLGYLKISELEAAIPMISVSGNLISPPPPEILDRGPHAIQAFFSDFVNKRLLNEVKIIVIGEGASGKTSLIKKLLGTKFDAKERQTHGIRISKDRFKYQGNDLKVHFWDFGGQEIMHATHQFFLTKRCLYLLVLDSRKDEKAEYWLNYIQNFGGNSPAIIVLNKHDENPSFDVNRGFLSEKYKDNIKGYHKVSCADEFGIEALRNDLLETLWKLDLRSTAYPEGWFKVKESLESMKEDYLNYSAYTKICTDNFVSNPESQKVLLTMLNDLGVVLNYEQLKWHDTNVLNPMWLTNAVYRIINSPIVAKNEGRFSIEELDAIINDHRYQKENPKHWKNIINFWKPEQKLSKFPEDKFLFIVAMMKEFELIYKFDEGKYIIPALLPDEQNTKAFAESQPVLKFLIEYLDFLPASILPRLIVKLHKYIYNNQVWKTGMVVEERLILHCTANIVLDKAQKKILIEVAGERRRDFLTVIRETIKEINSSYKGVEIVEWIPLPDLLGDETVLVDYNELLGFEAEKVKEYFSGKLRRKYPVGDLLNGIENPKSREKSNPIRIFVSFSEADNNYQEQFVKHAMPLIRLNKASIWSEFSIDAGSDREKELRENFENSDIIVCLLSSDLIASDLYESEVKKALEAHAKKEKVVVPVQIRKSSLGGLPIARLKSLPESPLKGINDDEAWTEVVEGLELVINDIKKRRSE